MEKLESEKKLDGTDDWKRKRFCDAGSGSRHGWKKDEDFSMVCASRLTNYKSSQKQENNLRN
eukprot:3831322-Ditylum_brightwellii.AAC.1